MIIRMDLDPEATEFGATRSPPETRVGVGPGGVEVGVGPGGVTVGVAVGGGTVAVGVGGGAVAVGVGGGCVGVAVGGIEVGVGAGRTVNAVGLRTSWTPTRQMLSRVPGEALGATVRSNTRFVPLWRMFETMIPAGVNSTVAVGGRGSWMKTPAKLLPGKPMFTEGVQGKRAAAKRKRRAARPWTRRWRQLMVFSRSVAPPAVSPRNPNGASDYARSPDSVCPRVFPQGLYSRAGRPGENLEAAAIAVRCS